MHITNADEVERFVRTRTGPDGKSKRTFTDNPEFVIRGSDSFLLSPFKKDTDGEVERDVRNADLFTSKFGKRVPLTARRILNRIGVAGAIIAGAAAIGTIVGAVAYYLSGRKKKLFAVAAAVTTFFVALPHLGNVFNVKNALSKMYAPGGAAGDFTKDLGTRNLRAAQRDFKRRYPDMAAYLRTAVKYGNNDHVNFAHAKGADALADLLFAEKRLVVDDVVRRHDDARILHTIVTGYRSYDEPSLKRAWQSLRLGATSWGAGALLPAEQAQGAGRLIPYNSIAALAGGSVLAAAAVQQSKSKQSAPATSGSGSSTDSGPSPTPAVQSPTPNTPQGAAYQNSAQYSLYNGGQSSKMAVTG